MFTVRTNADESNNSHLNDLQKNISAIGKIQWRFTGNFYGKVNWRHVLSISNRSAARDVFHLVIAFAKRGRSVSQLDLITLITV